MFFVEMQEHNDDEGWPYKDGRAADYFLFRTDDPRRGPYLTLLDDLTDYGDE